LEILILDNINKKLYSQNYEANKIWGVAQPEVDQLVNDAHQAIDNSRATTSNLDGIEMWELTYGITPDLTRDTEEDRVNRILEKRRDATPFTETWLVGNELSLDEEIKGEISERFPNGEVYAQVSGLRVRLYIDAAAAGLNARGFIRREFRELIPWVRSWIPGNVLLLSIAIGRRPLNESMIFIGGRGFRFSERTLKEAEHIFGKTIYVGGRGYRVSERKVSGNLRTQAFLKIEETGKVKPMYLQKDDGSVNEAFLIND